MIYFAPPGQSLFRRIALQLRPPHRNGCSPRESRGGGRYRESGVPGSALSAAIVVSQGQVAIPYADGLIKKSLNVGRPSFQRHPGRCGKAGIRVSSIPCPMCLAASGWFGDRFGLDRALHHKAASWCSPAEPGATECTCDQASRARHPSCFLLHRHRQPGATDCARYTLEEITRIWCRLPGHLSRRQCSRPPRTRPPTVCTALLSIGNYPIPMDDSIRSSKRWLEPAGIASTV